LKIKEEGNKVAIVGVGFVGSTIAYTLMLGGLVSEIVLIDINKDKAEGEAMDLRHGASFVRPVEITTGDYSGCQNADIVIITAGANQKPDETRLDLVKRNVDIFKDMIPKITKNISDDTLLLVVTNPVDILSYITWKISGLPPKRVIGSGTTLDSSRFRYILSQHCNIDARNIHGYIIGEHGDSEVAVWSVTNISGISFDQFCEDCGDKCDWEAKGSIASKVKESAYEIIEKKEATYYAIALAVRRIVESILRDENSILTLSTLMQGEYGLNDLYLSLPTIINKEGIRSTLTPKLSSQEKDGLINSAELLKKLIANLNL